MSDNTRTFIKIITQIWQRIFVQPWSMLTGGVLVGILSVITFAWARPWGVVGGLRNWADWFFYSLGVYGERPYSALVSTNSILTLGLMVGALAAALMAGQFAIRVPPLLEGIKGAVGGILLGTGAALAGGCNVGGFYTSISALSLSGVVMMAGLMLGSVAGLKYLYWEMENVSFGGGKSQIPTIKQSGVDWKKIQPWLGAAIIVVAFIVSEVYTFYGYIFVGGLLLCGMGFGFILHRSRFCFARCFREPFMTGDGEVARAVIVSILISMIGFATLKWVGLRMETIYVTPNFGLGALVGGFIFGFGMLVTGGCGSGTAWRAVEGQVKLVIALIFFALSNSLVRAWIDASELLRKLVGFEVFIPDLLGYQGTLVTVTVFMMLWYVLVNWNEETERFVMEV